MFLGEPVWGSWVLCEPVCVGFESMAKNLWEFSAGISNVVGDFEWVFMDVCVCAL